jgi:uncharacterized membrane protein
MNEQPNLPTTPATQGTDSITTAQIVYGLYLASIVTFGLASVVGVVVAYVFRGEAPAWLKAHYTLQIRTFWIGLLYGLAAWLLTVVGIGFLLSLVVLVWLVVRCVKGFQYLAKREAYPNAETWFW